MSKPFSHCVVTLVYDGLCTFEFGTAVEMFGRPQQEFQPWYTFEVCALEKTAMSFIGGLTIVPTAHGSGRMAAADTIIIPGWRNPDERPPSSLLKALQKANMRGARIVSFSSGIFVLAAAGLLDNRQATTHWRYEEAIKTRFPKIRLVPDVLYVDEGDLLTSAGIGAGVDTSLYIIRKDLGTRIANRMALRFVSSKHRQGEEAQKIDSPMGDDNKTWLSELSNWVLTHLHTPISIDHLARQVHMSRRTFLRRFSAQTGRTPGRWVAELRVGRAKDLLTQTTLSVDEIASRSGFQSASALRHHFRINDRLAPTEYRRRALELSTR